MGASNVMQTGHTGMIAAKTAMRTTGHNIANANTEGYSRQRVEQKSQPAIAIKGITDNVGRGVQVDRIERYNDNYVTKQLRDGQQELSNMEERDLLLLQVEDIFNEMNGEGMNRLMTKFFNEFRKLANDPDSEAVRQSVREATNAMVQDFKRLRSRVTDVQSQIDNRVEGYVSETNSLIRQLGSLNQKIVEAETAGRSANDLLDSRDRTLQELGKMFDLSVHYDDRGNFNVDLKGIGPILNGVHGLELSTQRSSADPSNGKRDGSVDILMTGSANNKVTHAIRGGKFGALVEVRDSTLTNIIDKLDDLAFSLTRAVNQVHTQGYGRTGRAGVEFFKGLTQKAGAAENIDLSDSIKASVDNIAAGALPNATGDNRIANSIANIQNLRIMNEGKVTTDDWFNSIVSDVGVKAGRNREALDQQRGIIDQITKIRDQVAGVSIDEETANLLQYQQAFDASAKVIQVADEMLETVLNLKR